MSMNILNDISDVYVQEVLKPKLGVEKPKAKEESGAKEGPKDPKEASAKKIRQAVYDIRYRARREEVPLPQAYNQYMSHTTMSGPEKAAVKAKLGEGFVAEAEAEDKKFKVRVTDKNSGKSYVRYATREKINALRSNPNISSVEMTQYGTPYEGEKKKGEQTAKAKAGKGLDPVGQEDKDIDNDGDHDKTDKYLLNRRKVRGAAIAKKDVKEGYSNWREDLREIADEVEGKKKEPVIKEKKVKNKVVINPKLGEAVEAMGGQLIEMVELDEGMTMKDFKANRQKNKRRSVSADAEKRGHVGKEWYNSGRKYSPDEAKRSRAKMDDEERRTRHRSAVDPDNEDDNNYSADKTKNPKKLRKQKAMGELGEALDKRFDSMRSRGGRSAPPEERSVGGEMNRKNKDYWADTLGKNRDRGKGSKAAKRASALNKEGFELDEKTLTSTETKKKEEIVKSMKKSAGDFEKRYPGRGKEVMYATATKMAKKVAEQVVPQQQQKQADNKTADVQADAQKKQQLQQMRTMIMKKRQLQNQQLSLQKQGKLPLDTQTSEEFVPEAKAVGQARSTDVNPKGAAVRASSGRGMTMTPAKGLGASKPAGDDKARAAKQKAQAKADRIAAAKDRAASGEDRLSKLIKSVRSEEVETVSELNRYEREKGINTKTNRPTQTGGAKDDKAFTSVKRSMRKMEGTPAGQQKKVPGKKPPAAGEYGAPRSPAQKVAMRRAAAKRAQDAMHSRFD